MLPLQNAGQESKKILVSWKEIASFLERAERTAKRWERDRGLPVHRVPGGERGGVFAYPEELQAWLLGEQGKAAQSIAEEVENDSVSEVAFQTTDHKDQQIAIAQSTGREGADAGLAARSAGTHGWVAWVAASGLILATAVTFLVAVRAHRSAIAGDGRETQPTTHDPGPAEQFYLQGRYEWSLRTADSLRRSIDAYTQAIVKDPSYARAYAGLAESYDLLPEYEGFDRNEAFSRAKDAADRAIELDSNVPAGHRAKAFAMFYGDWDSSGSDAEFRKALSLAPNEVETHHWYATTLFSRREKTQALGEIDEAVRLSPTNPAIVADAAFLHVELGDNVETNIKTLRELARTQPNLVKASRYLEGIDLGRKDYSAYLADLRQTVAIAHNADESALLSAVKQGWERGGAHGMLIAMRDVNLAALSRGDNRAYDLAMTCEALGESRSALHYIDVALEMHDVRVSWMRKDFKAPEIENEPEYRALLARIDQRLHINPSPSLHLAVTMQPEQLATGSSGRR